MFGMSWPESLLLGAATAPTDAAAVSVLLRLSRAAVPFRVAAALEVESGLNDPMSVYLTVSLVQARSRILRVDLDQRADEPAGTSLAQKRSGLPVSRASWC